MRTNITSDKQYVSGTLDPNFSVGRGTIIEYVVMKTLEDCKKERFNYAFDLSSSTYGSINVKSSSSHRGGVNPTWHFIKTPNSYVPNYYICVGLDSEFKKILRVWIIPGDSKIVKTRGIVITDSDIGRKKALDYEVDPAPYQSVFTFLNIESLPEFRNINIDNFKIYKAITQKVKKGYSPMDLIDDYGEELYQEYLFWVKRSNLKKCFNIYNGSVCTYNTDPRINENLDECFAEITPYLYPIYDYAFKFTGYYYNGSILKPAMKPSEHKSKMKTIEGIIKLYTIKYGKISIDDLKRELQEKQIDVDNLEMVLRKFMMRGDLLRKSPTEYFAVL